MFYVIFGYLLKSFGYKDYFYKNFDYNYYDIYSNILVIYLCRLNVWLKLLHILLSWMIFMFHIITIYNIYLIDSKRFILTNFTGSIHWIMISRLAFTSVTYTVIQKLRIRNGFIENYYRVLLFANQTNKHIE